MNTDEQIKEQIKTTFDLLTKVQNKKTIAYIDGLYSLKCGYESLQDFDNAVKYASEIIELINSGSVQYDDKYKQHMSDVLVSCYDTKARQGDFESFCIAMEWNRPIEKQFYLPRARLLKKHGVIQGVQDLIDDKLDLLVLNLPPRIGKLLSNSTPILTKNGWKKHGDLQVGDYVLNHKGKFVKVLATSPEYPCNCRVTFANGEQIDCHENHEWLVYDRWARKEKIIETKEMMGKVRELDKNNPENTHTHFRFSLPMKDPVMGEWEDLPVQPYTFGAWLGDGTNRSPYISNPTFDRVIIDSIEKDGYKIKGDWIHKTTGVHTVAFDNLRFDLHELGFCYAHRAVTKYIPDIYLTASLEQRLDLLAGLLDTDGTLSKTEHRYQYVTSDEILKDSFVALVSTFGWRCSITKHKPKQKQDKWGIQGKKDYWSIGFNPTFEIPCRVPRKQLKVFSKPRKITITNIEKIENCEMGKCIQVEGGVYLAGKTLLPTHNSTIGLFVQALLGGMYPDESILAAGHTTGLIDSFYDEIMNLITDDEYRYSKIFPNNKIVDKSSEYHFIDLNKKKRFHTYNYISIETGGTGKVQAERLLYCDDLVKDVEQANNPDRLEKLYHNYTSTIKDRKIQRLCKDGVYRPCPEMHLNTPWSLYDVTSRVVANAKSEGDMDRVRIISVPCYDEHGESNFMYDYGKGFDRKYYHDMEVAEDPVIFSAKYLMTPVERDGLVFNKDNVCYYNELPADEPDKVVAYADVTHGGDDYFSMPIGFVYGSEVYIEDVLFINKFGGDNKSRPLVRDIIMKYHVTRVGVEKNNGGDFYSTLMTQDLLDKHYRCHITSHNAPTNKAKRDRILACQDDIKGIATERNTYRVYFKQPDKIKGNKQYQLAMKNLFGWNQNIAAQNKQHDDFPDSLAGLITNVLGGNKKSGIARSNITAEKFGL